MPTLRQQALSVVVESNPGRKASIARSSDPTLPAGAACDLATSSVVPGRPEHPLLVPPTDVVRRSVSTREGRAAMIHALAHIELNAIDLAADACWRYAGLPDDFYRDWSRVMREEALHFQLLCAHLETLDHRYGDFPAHNALWEMAERTRDDVVARVALVPRTLEARGLDASPAVRHKLASAGDAAGARIIDLILQDEIGHVAVGNRWYAWLCERDGLDPVETYASLAARHGAPRLRPPFNLAARKQAGFTSAELAVLQADPP